MLPVREAHPLETWNCKRCIGGRLVRDSDGEVVCVQCGALHQESGELAPNITGNWFEVKRQTARTITVNKTHGGNGFKSSRDFRLKLKGVLRKNGYRPGSVNIERRRLAVAELRYRGLTYKVIAEILSKDHRFKGCEKMSPATVGQDITFVIKSLRKIRHSN